MKEVLFPVIRHLLTAGGALLAAKGIEVTGTDLDTIAGAIVAVVGLGWSIWEKRKAK